MMRMLRSVAVGGLLVGGMCVAVPTASAADCPAVEVIFARGTFEPAGVGATGQAFVDALQSRLGDEAVEIHPVDYPASLDFPRAADGIADASATIGDLSNRCPNTRVVLGGYSQGAAVAAYTTSDSVPSDYVLPAGITGPMPPSAARHVAAVVLFGKPTSGVLDILDRSAPPIVIGKAYKAKTLELCAPEDPVCSAGGSDRGAHSSYRFNGMTDQAADFAAGKLGRR